MWNTGNATVDGASLPQNLRLEDCLDHFTSAETLSDIHICESCGAAVKREKQLTIDTLPNVLVVHLKRFDALEARKVANTVEFPTDRPLDLGPYLSRWRATEDTIPTLPHLYELNAVVNHHGDMEKGHYTSFIKDGGQWFHCDDHLVTCVDVDTVKHSEGYILFYVREAIARLNITKGTPKAHIGPAIEGYGPVSLKSFCRTW